MEISGAVIGEACLASFTFTSRGEWSPFCNHWEHPSTPGQSYQLDCRSNLATILYLSQEATPSSISLIQVVYLSSSQRHTYETLLAPHQLRVEGLMRSVADPCSGLGNKGNCSHICLHDEETGKAVCKCPKYHRLMPDGKTCERYRDAARVNPILP